MAAVLDEVMACAWLDTIFQCYYAKYSTSCGKEVLNPAKKYETARHEVKICRNGVILDHVIRPDPRRFDTVIPRSA